MTKKVVRIREMIWVLDPGEKSLGLFQKEDLPFLANPHDLNLKEAARKLAEEIKAPLQEDFFPFQSFGTGANLNEAAENGLERIANLFGMPIDEF